MPVGGGGGGVLWISSDGDDQRIFGGRKISQVFFGGALIKVGIFFRYSKQSKVCLFVFFFHVISFNSS